MHGFPGGAVVKNLSTNTGDVGGTGLIPRSGRFPQEENGNPLQYVCLDKHTEEPGGLPSMGVSKSQMQLSIHARKRNTHEIYVVHDMEMFLEKI